MSSGSAEYAEHQRAINSIEIEAKVGPTMHVK